MYGRDVQTHIQRHETHRDEEWLMYSLALQHVLYISLDVTVSPHCNVTFPLVNVRFCSVWEKKGEQVNDTQAGLASGFDMFHIKSLTANTIQSRADLFP